MNLPDYMVRRAAVKKRKAIGNAEPSRKRPQTPSPPRSPNRSLTPAPLIRRLREHQEQPLGGQEPVLPMDLTADTPPEGPPTKAAPPTEEQILPNAEPSCPAIEPTLGGASLGAQVEPYQAMVSPQAKEERSASDAALTASHQAGADREDEPDALPARPSLTNQGLLAEQLVIQLCRLEL